MQSLDKIIIGSFILFFVSAISLEYINAVAPGNERITNEKTSKWIWPPQFVLKSYYSWCENVDPILLNNDYLIKYFCCLSLLILAPFYLIGIYAIYNKKQWIRVPMIICALILFFGSNYFFYQALFGVEKTRNLLLYTSVYAEPTDGDNSLYKVEVDLTTNANDFQHQSGTYELNLMVGDALLQNGFSWKIKDTIQLSFHEESAADKDHSSFYSAKPEIIHQFRADEKRPPTIVSLVFSALTLLPLLVLLVLWVTLGFNLSGLPLGLSPLGFHISHGAVFALMFFYWKYLDMFQTIRYLALVSIPLFLFGHRLLAILAARW
ncbi:unnamed protein product [Adineta steineri]|uniref:Dolichyl-diphosphooligosaccharide--protein glycosyltransferase subunit 2 n=1 Tax=Adineta steineri TaxID=433720 RepID=A0A815SE99_9BILA|nr:unnamed protein product [Adineta steineri]